jgi:hypothetical protein
MLADQNITYNAFFHSTLASTQNIRKYPCWEN